MGKKKKKTRKKRPAQQPPKGPPSRPAWQWVLLVLFGLAILALTYTVVLGDMSRASQEDLQQREGAPDVKE